MRSHSGQIQGALRRADPEVGRDGPFHAPGGEQAADGASEMGRGDTFATEDRGRTGVAITGPDGRGEGDA